MVDEHEEADNAYQKKKAEEEPKEEKEEQSNESNRYYETELDPDGYTVISMRVNRINEEVVEQYKEAIRGKQELPLIYVYEDEDSGERYSGDGVHRTAAYKALGMLARVSLTVVRDAKRSALRDALKANFDHGLPRTHADKRKAVLTALADGIWGKITPKEIARKTGTSHTFVRKLQKEGATPCPSGDPSENTASDEVKERLLPASEPADINESVAFTHSVAEAGDEQSPQTQPTSKCVKKLGMALEILRRLPIEEEWIAGEDSQAILTNIIKEARRLSSQYRPDRIRKFDPEPLREFINTHNLTVKDAGRLIGVSHAAVSRWLNGKATPDPKYGDVIQAVVRLDAKAIKNKLKEE